MAAVFLQVRSREFRECGEFRGSKELVKLEECNSDIGNHFRTVLWDTLKLPKDLYPVILK